MGGDKSSRRVSHNACHFLDEQRGRRGGATCGRDITSAEAWPRGTAGPTPYRVSCITCSPVSGPKETDFICHLREDLNIIHFADLTSRGEASRVAKPNLTDEGSPFLPSHDFIFICKGYQILLKRQTAAFFELAQGQREDRALLRRLLQLDPAGQPQPTPSTARVIGLQMSFEDMEASITTFEAHGTSLPVSSRADYRDLRKEPLDHVGLRPKTIVTASWLCIKKSLVIPSPWHSSSVTLWVRLAVHSAVEVVKQVTLELCLLPEGSGEKRPWPGWEGSAMIFLARFSALESCRAISQLEQRQQCL
ncbi:hypothetical protein SKAU_G00213580 [Synaphobranchus kaupii]|uniref:Uncharacterized protein n=1 Tax=Synaphobranchus kaupii TaxID=118154 RepID=A0A9Q1IV63_SYNKA|nr:hypothetical protein SKAU_G00213580 [Synaphobranchus kaupii]